MRDLKADWRRWSWAERFSALMIPLSVSVAVALAPVVLQSSVAAAGGGP